MTFKDFGLTRVAIMRHVVSIADPAPPTLDVCREKWKAQGLTNRGTPPIFRSTKHPDLAGLDRKSYNREVARRWRKANPPGSSSGKRKVKT